MYSTQNLDFAVTLTQNLCKLVGGCTRKTCNCDLSSDQLCFCHTWLIFSVEWGMAGTL